MVNVETSWVKQLGSNGENHGIARTIREGCDKSCLRACGVTKMFSAKVTEKIIMEQSGHKSVEGVRQFE